MIKSRDGAPLRDAGATGRAIDVQRLDRSPDGLAAYRRFPGQLTFFSDVNGAVARWAWEQVPYREVPYAEDQLLGREMIEAGYAKVFHPDARRAPLARLPAGRLLPPLLRRVPLPARGARLHVEPCGPRRTSADVRGLVGARPALAARRRALSGRALARPLAGLGAATTPIRMAGAIVGTRADRAAARRCAGALSLEGRDCFTPLEVPESPLLASRRARPEPSRRPGLAVGVRAPRSYPRAPRSRSSRTPARRRAR